MVGSSWCIIGISSVAERSLQTFHGGECVLVGIEGEEFPCIEIDGGGDMEQVKTAVTTAEGAELGNVLTGDEGAHEVGFDDGHEPVAHVITEVGQHFFSLVEGIADVGILAVAEGLETNGLAKFPDQELCDVQWLGHGCTVGEGTFRIFLSSVESTEERGVWVSDQLRSPSSASRISWTSAAEKTRSPQVSFMRRRWASASNG